MPTSRIEADYLLETPADPRRVAELMAGEQSSGTFVAIPGETPELKARVAAQVIRLEILDETAKNPSLPSAHLHTMPEAPFHRAKVTLSWRSRSRNGVPSGGSIVSPAASPNS